jgi:23S rRNA (uracil1939-C5)-methyltransferase
MKNKKSVKIKVIIEKLGGEGVGIARYDGKTVFVPYTVPEDIVEAEIIQDKKNFSKAKITDVIKESPYRTKPQCVYFGTCGGCSHQNISYNYQLKFKHDLLKEIFRKHLKIGLQIEPVIASALEYKYRNKMMIHCFTKDGKKILAGFHKFNSHELVEIKRCPLHSDEINDLLNSTLNILNESKVSVYNSKTRRGLLKDIVIRESSSGKDLLLTLVINEKGLKQADKISKKLFKKHDRLKGFYVYHNPHDTDYVFKDSEKIYHNTHKSPLQKIYGDYIADKISGINFRISPVSFFQVNTNQAQNIVRYIENIVLNNKDKDKSLIDAYAGIGTMSLPLAKNFKNVYAVEFVNNAAMLGKENAALNKINNYKSYVGDAAREIKKLLQKIDIDKLRNEYKYIIVDPPRSGLNNEMIGLLCYLKIKNVFYVSCNPIIQTRDIDKLMEKAAYKVKSIQPFDMFPQTFHIENVVELVLN